jgi:(p)ppGpp synthase/HD superfamily hydrolase
METARDMAVRAHASQKYGDQPYEVHLDEVVAILTEYGYTDPDTINTGYLHDTLEDTDLTFTDIGMVFGMRVAEAVTFNTDEEGTSRKARKSLTYARMRKDVDAYAAMRPFPESVGIAMRVKLADRLANLRQCRRTQSSLLSMYQKEADTFKNALFLSGHSDLMWLEYDRLLDT